MLATFYRFASSSGCLEIAIRTPTFPAQAPGLKESASADAIDARHDGWKARLPKDEGGLWDALTALDGTAQAALFAHCASSAVNALHEPANRYNEGRVSAHGVRRRLDQADVLARAVGLDMVAAGWKPTADNYLGRVTKPRILQAVREAKGEPSVQLIDHLKKGDMAREAERLLDGTGWLPEPLRLDIERAGSGWDSRRCRNSSLMTTKRAEPKTIGHKSSLPNSPRARARPLRTLPSPSQARHRAGLSHFRRTIMSAHSIYDNAPLGSLIRYSDGTLKPPARFAESVLHGTSQHAGRTCRRSPRPA